MTTTFEAVYERGVLRPLKPVELPEGTKVEVTVRPGSPSPKSIAAALAEIAAKAPAGPDDSVCASRDHDKILYSDPHK